MSETNRTTAAPESAADPTMSVTISLSSAATNVTPEQWRATIERLADRISDEVFEAGGSINVGDCRRPWCVEGRLSDVSEGGEHARHHTGEMTKVVESDERGSSWWAHLLQAPGDVGAESVNIVFSSDADVEFVLPVWQVVALQGLIEGDASSKVWALTEQAAGREPEL